MVTRTNRVAWGLAAILAVVVLGGSGVMLSHGIWVGRYRLERRASHRWAFGRRLGACSFGSVYETFDLGFIALHTVRPLGEPIYITLSRFRPACAGSTAAHTARVPVKLTADRGRLIITPVPALRQAIRRYFPGYELPPITAFDPGLRKLFVMRRPPPGEPAVSFVCVGDFDGNGLPDVVMFLKNRQNRWLLVAFHQTYRGGFHPYRLARMKATGLFNCWITLHSPGRMRSYMAEKGEDKGATVQSKHDWIEEEDDEATENFGFYFKSGRYRSVQPG